MHSKGILREVYVAYLKKIISIIFSIHPFLRPKIVLPNEFYCHKQLMRSKSYLKEDYIASLKKIVCIVFF